MNAYECKELKNFGQKVGPLVSPTHWFVVFYFPNPHIITMNSKLYQVLENYNSDSDTDTIQKTFIKK